MTSAELINALCLPHCYPHPVEVITTIETHISVVFLTGPYAYKLKKNVNFGFLDFSSLAKRKQFCELEVTLNRRYAPQLYIDVVAVYIDKDSQVTLDPEQANSDPIDYLVKMNQFDPNQVLGRYLQNESLNTQQVETLALQIADFHQQAEPVALDSLLGEPKTILQPMLDNFPTLYQSLDSVHHQRLDQLHHWTLTQFNLLTPLITQRRQQGYVRACHGDLHIDNITLIDHTPVLFDGIEFNEEFRWIDVISDLAFLLIDLDYRQKPQLHRRILSLYLSRTNDLKGLKLLPFYQVYRALVRAKITVLRANQLSAKSFDHALLMDKSLNYINLAEQYIRPLLQPKLVLLQGVSGSGKSHLADHLLSLMDAVIISSDRTRKQLYGISALHRVKEVEKSALYSPEMNKKTYETMLERAERLLGLGRSVIVDATFLKRVHRQSFATLARKIQCHNYLIYIQATPEIAAQAIRNRETLNDNPSDAGIEIMQQQSRVLDEPSSEETPLILNAKQLRDFFPDDSIKEFLQLPIT